jgi:bacterioferritin-associated ferredoxin
VYVCICKAVTREDACRAASQGKCTREAIANEFGLDREDACGRCIQNIERFMVAQSAGPPATLGRASASRPVVASLLQS